MLANASFVVELRTLGQEVQTVDGLPESTAPPASPSGTWDAAAADKLLADVHVLIDGAKASGLASTPVRQAVLEDYRSVVVGLHARRDVSLWEALDGVELLLSRWREWDAKPKPVPKLVPVVSRGARRRKETDE